MKKRRMTAKQLKYFGKRKKSKRRNVNMARRRSRTRTIYRTARRGYRSRKGLLSGSMGNVIIGAAAGAVSPMIPQFIGNFTNPVLFGVAGYFLKKPALLTVAGYEAGQALIGGNLFSGGNGGVFL